MTSPNNIHLHPAPHGQNAQPATSGRFSQCGADSPAAHDIASPTSAEVPAVSVLMLCYNRPQYMREAIESVLNQTFADFEFIILDNGSDGDEVFNIAKEIADQDSRIRLSRGGDLGVHKGRNAVLAKARAEFVATIEDDDYWVLDKLQRQVDFMRVNPDVAIYCCSRTFINETGQKTGEWILNTSISPRTTREEDISLFNFSGSGQLFRRQALLTVGGWREYFINADDHDLYYRLQENYSYASTNEKLICYRRWGNSLSNRHDGFYYPYTAVMSALYRRRGQHDPIDSNPDVQDFMWANMVDMMRSACGISFVMRSIRQLIRGRHYSDLRKLMNAYKKSGRPRRKVFLKLLNYSVRYGRLWYWFTR